MYRVFTSLWSKLPAPPIPASSSSSSTTTTTSTQLTSDTAVDEDGWVFVSDIGLFIYRNYILIYHRFSGSASKVTSPNDNNSIMTNSWIASPPIMRTDQSPSINRSSSPNTHHFNPIENLLIEHASMSVYEQIASRTRSKRQRKIINDNKLDEQVEGGNNDDDDDEDEDDDDDDRSSVVLQVRLLISINKSIIFDYLVSISTPEFIINSSSQFKYFINKFIFISIGIIDIIACCTSSPFKSYSSTSTTIDKDFIKINSIDEYQ